MISKDTESKDGQCEHIASSVRTSRELGEPMISIFGLRDNVPEYLTTTLRTHADELLEYSKTHGIKEAAGNRDPKRAFGQVNEVSS
jgi:hypothetical protein